MNISQFYIVNPYRKYNIDDVYRKNNTYMIQNCCIVGRNTYYPNCLIYDQKSLYNPYDEKIMSLNKSSFYDNNEYYGEVHEVFTKKYNDVYFFIYNFDNYYHFIYDTLPYLINFMELKKEIPDLLLLINYPNKKNTFYKFNTDIFDLLNIKYIIHEKNALYKNMYVSNSLTHGGYSNQRPCKLVYDFFATIAKNNIYNKLSNITKIYISRRTWIRKNNDNIGTNYTTRRKMINEDNIVKFLKNKGYIEVFTEDYNLVDKINLFYNATHVIGAIGGGMCNLLFSQKSTKVLCIVSPDFLNINYRFRYSMDHTNIEYFNNCLVSTTSKISLYTRVKITDISSEYFNKIGEIINVFDDKYTINISNNDIAGFNNDFIYSTSIFLYEQFEPLDNGLNSPYIVDENAFISICENY